MHVPLHNPSIGRWKNIDEKWIRCKNAITDTCEQVLGCREVKRKDWITDDTWEAIEARGETKMKLNKEADDTRKKNCGRNIRKETKQLKRRQRGTKKHVEKLKITPESCTRSPDS